MRFDPWRNLGDILLIYYHEHRFGSEMRPEIKGFFESTKEKVCCLCDFFNSNSKNLLP